jgi:large subunit ribosomal protein L25
VGASRRCSPLPARLPADGAVATAFPNEDSMQETLNVQLRDHRGTRHSRRMRRDGQIPAVLYGHQAETLSLACAADDVSKAIRHGSRLVALSGGVNEKAFIREVQWDTLGMSVLHLDLTRISEDERVEVTVRLELRGEAPGAREGGVVDQTLKEIDLECPAMGIPDKLEVNINELHLGGSISIADLELPPGVKSLQPETTMVVHCIEPAAAEEEEAGVVEGAEPELIGRKPEDEEEAEE